MPLKKSQRSLKKWTGQKWTTASGKKSSRKFKLTPSQVAIAKRLNVPLEEYAKHIEGV